MKRIFLLKKRSIVLMMADLSCIALSCVLSCFLLMSIRLFPAMFLNTSMYTSIAIYSMLSVIMMYFLGVYRVMWRYAQLREFISCVGGIITSTIVFSIYYRINEFDYFVLYYLVCGLISSSATVLMRGAYICIHYYTSKKRVLTPNNKVMIIGAGNGGTHICNLMKQDKDGRYNPVAFVDDDSSKIGRSVNGVPVVGNTNEIPRIAKDMNISEIVLAIPSISTEQKKRILHICYETLCKVHILPDLSDYIENEKVAGQMKKVKIEDLLGRETVKLNNKQTADMINSKVCMITGGGGSIGSELTRQICKMKPKKVIIVDIYENNAYDIQQELIAKYGDNIDLTVQIASVRDYDKMDELFTMFKPNLVFHAAAHKHVPLMETNPEEAVKNNVFGTLNTAKLAKKHECEKFVLVSTDKAVNPTNIMGATKRCCEMIVECMAQSKSKTEFVAVRFGNVLGSNGSVIPLFEKQIANGGPITVTDPSIIRYFMTIPEAASLILQAATMARGGEVFVLDMGEPVRIVKLAENLIRLHGYRPYKDIDIIFTGLRPGEKLYEELLMDEEGLKSTANRKIFIGHQIEVDEEDFLSKLELLRTAALENNKEEIERLLKVIVPTFIRRKQYDDSIITVKKAVAK